MTRGRKKDMTIPPTRSLVQQRDYRARKAHYIAELEGRCRKAEDENKRLRQELEVARANMSMPFLYNPLAAEMSAELVHSLAMASESLVKFQDFARRHPLTHDPPSSSRLDSLQLPPLQEPLRTAPHLHPVLPPIPSLRHPTGHSHHDPLDQHRERKRFYREDSSSPQPNDIREQTSGSFPRPQRSSSISDSDCCDGYFDCDRFCDTSPGTSVPAPLHSNERTTLRVPTGSSSSSSSGDK